MILSNNSLSGITISKTFDNVIHTNCFMFNSIMNNNSIQFSTFDGYGTILPFSFQYNNSLNYIKDNSRFNNIAPTVFFDNISANELLHDANQNTIYNVTNTEIKNHTTSSIGITSYNMYNLKTLPIDHLFENNTFNSDKLPKSLTATYSAKQIGNVEYITKAVQAWQGIYKLENEKQFRNINKLVWAYRNNGYSNSNNASITFYASQDDFDANGKLYVVVMGSACLNTQNTLNCKLWVDGQEYTTGTHCYGSRSHTTSATGNRIVAFCKPVMFTKGNGATTACIINITSEHCNILNNSVVVLNGRQFSNPWVKA